MHQACPVDTTGLISSYEKVRLLTGVLMNGK
jgi:hypothetical protein